MQQIINDPTKQALIDAVAAGLAGSGILATQAVCRLSGVLPVYLANIPNLEQGAMEFIAYMHGGPMPEWFKHATQ